NGNFPTLLPDPTKAKTFDLIKEKFTKDREIYHIGIAFDGDGDRIGFITIDNEILSPDKVGMIFSKNICQNQQQPKILIDVKISAATKEYIEKHGGVVELTKVGHSWVHEKLININAALAIELSGHYYFNDRYYGFDDGLYAGLRMLEILDNFISNNESFTDHIINLPSYFSTPEFRKSMPADKQQKILKDLEIFVENTNGVLLNIDGIRGEYSDGWFIARMSGTESALSYRVEGKNNENRDKLLKSLEDIISKYAI
ncbi:MAG: hypothetical protein OEZ01_08845, partial [Candidatus Heimdallarchaeota archaeon]|nr:hypothetical protein [Candidatus Heimdallarchaeota archaeon]